MSEFKISYHKTDTAETGWVLHTSDSGEETWDGISRKWWGDLPLWEYIDQCKKDPSFPDNIQREKLEPQKQAFYRLEFWNKISGDSIPYQILADELYDIAVNMSPRKAGLYLQRALNLLNRKGLDYPDIVADGAIGKNTLKALSGYVQYRGIEKLNILLYWIHIQRAAKWFNLALNDSDQEDFMNGWGKRGFQNFKNIVEWEPPTIVEWKSDSL